jgi:hypothetical protein
VRAAPSATRRRAGHGRGAGRPRLRLRRAPAAGGRAAGRSSARLSSVTVQARAASTGPGPCAPGGRRPLLCAHTAPRRACAAGPPPHSRTGRFAGEVLRTTAELEAVVTIICANQRQMPRRDPLRPYMEVIAEHAESESPVKPSQVRVGGRRRGARSCRGRRAIGTMGNPAALARFAASQWPPVLSNPSSCFRTRTHHDPAARLRLRRSARGNSTSSSWRLMTWSTTTTSRGWQRCGGGSRRRSTTTRARTRSTRRCGGPPRLCPSARGKQPRPSMHPVCFLSSI